MRKSLLIACIVAAGVATCNKPEKPGVNSSITKTAQLVFGITWAHCSVEGNTATSWTLDRTFDSKKTGVVLMKL